MLPRLLLGHPMWMTVSLFMGGHHLHGFFWFVAVARADLFRDSV